jgi:ATP-binding cassette subfamily B protein
VVKAFARQAYEIDKFETENWEKYLRGKRLLLMHSGYWPVSDILTGIQMLGGLAVGAFMAINGTITVGAYITYAGLLVWILWPIRNLGRLIVQMSSGLVSFDRVMTVVKEKREPLDTGKYLSPSIPVNISRRAKWQVPSNLKILGSLTMTLQMCLSFKKLIFRSNPGK